ncbi:MAG TPA: HEAT repeat domain-containing protein [Gemmataceae bacterium]|nr:HEAT repeat domain-containing protein [Gemmataceae bacterium]
MATAASDSGALVRQALAMPAAVYNAFMRATALLLPVMLFVPAVCRHPNGVLWAGMGVQGAGALVLCARWQDGRRLPMQGVLALYLLVLLWLWPAALVFRDSYLSLAVGLALVIVLLTAALVLVSVAGAPAARRARLAAARLAHRRDWPADLAACRTVPGVKALRAALAHDPTPALALLTHDRPAVQVAALAALEGRTAWHSDHAELVLELARSSAEPAVRTGVLMTLSTAQRRPIVEGMAEFLRDPDQGVRQAAVEALFADTRQRWSWIRGTLQALLADPTFAGEGALIYHGPPLSSEAIEDLTGWACQKGTLGVRAGLTLQAYYRAAVEHGVDEALLASLRQQLADPQSPAGLRTELAQLLHQHQLLDTALQEQLLDPLNPAPLRLVAASALLTQGTHEGAVSALRDLARLPNREMALATAELVQRHLGVDLGLPIGRPLPPVHTRQAAEVTRRVMAWAAGQVPDAPALPQGRTRTF